MKVSMNWIKKYADIPVSAAEYESRMIMTGTGVEGTEYLGSHLANVVAGKVMTCENHPDSDHLHVCTVDVGEPEYLQIVCGAPNVKTGVLVPVAKIGAELPGGTIKKGKLRGVESFGMLCSGPEIGVPVELYPSVGDAGLLIFNEEYAPGTPVAGIFGLDDTVVDFEILANRPDCLCVWGVSRETAAAMGTELKLPEITVKEADGDIVDYAKVDVTDFDICSRYAAKVVKNVRIGPSPAWMRQYLHAAGMRSINNIVDITNFVMLETGHPMHAFDLSKVKNGHIIVRKAEKGESLTTLDGKHYDLPENALMICDENGPTGLAGIMGGEESEITENTKEILFECASFDRTSIRLTSRAMGIRTESSGRFERGVSAATVMDALLRACQMVNELDAGDVVPGVIDLYPAPIKPAELTVSCKRISHRAGVEVAPEKMKEILEKLLFKVELNGDEMKVVAPIFRQDIDQEADICEEVLRYAGYDLIPSTRLRGETPMGGKNDTLRNRDRVCAFLTGEGFYETMTFSFISHKSIEQLSLDANDPRLTCVSIRNPLGEDTQCMRTTLLPGVLKTLSTNINGGNENGRIYEMGDVFDGTERTEEGLPVQRVMLTLGCWGEGGDFFSVRGIVEMLLKREGIKAEILPSDEKYLHPGRQAKLIYGDTVLATVGELHPDIAARFDIDGRVCIAEVNLPGAYANATAMGTVKSIARFPAVSRDIALVMEDAQPVGPVMVAIEKACGKMMESIRLFDIFRGVQVGEGKKSVAFSLIFRAEDHTLTEDEINRLMKKALKVSNEQFGAELRS